MHAGSIAGWRSRLDSDAMAWRSRGVPVYGADPYPITNEDLQWMHGNDERVPVDSLEEGTNYVYQAL